MIISIYSNIIVIVYLILHLIDLTPFVPTVYVVIYVQDIFQLFYKLLFCFTT